eukprot:946012-Rhodomonas_salina.1
MAAAGLAARLAHLFRSRARSPKNQQKTQSWDKLCGNCIRRCAPSLCARNEAECAQRVRCLMRGADVACTARASTMRACYAMSGHVQTRSRPAQVSFLLRAPPVRALGGVRYCRRVWRYVEYCRNVLCYVQPSTDVARDAVG